MTTLRGANVLLRPMRTSDMPRQREFFQDAELAELDSSSLEAHSKIDVEEFFLSPSASGGETASFAIDVRGEYVGYARLMNLKNSNKVFELGIFIGDRRFWGRGYGKEVVKLLLQHGFSELDGREIELTTHQKNERAVACFSACGFTEQRRVHRATLFDGQYVDMIEMSIARERWLRSRI
jgi:RimJ/RimL family protein N-acetyltransferase